MNTDEAGLLDTIRKAANDEALALELIEELRWGASPVCPLCGSADVYRMTGRDGEREAHKRWRCRGCRKMYSARTGSIFEASRIELKIWVHALWRMVASKKGFSALQLQREIPEITYPTALYLLHRLRFAMQGDWGGGPRLAGVVECDETRIGGKPRRKYPGAKPSENPNILNRDNKPIVAAMVQRGGKVRIRRISGASRKVLEQAIREVVDPSAKVMTDEHSGYKFLDKGWPGGHGTTVHSRGQYALPDGTHSNTAECVFSLVKRGIVGIWHSVSRHRLPLYLNEFEFRWNSRDCSDAQRFVMAVRNAEGKRLRYRTLAGT